MFKITSLKLSNVNGISDLEISLNQSLNLICGPNGIGKTTILESIAQSFCTLSALKLKKKAGTTSGNIQVSYNDGTSNKSSSYKIISFFPHENDSGAHGQFQNASHILLIKSDRYFSHQPLNSIEKDPSNHNDYFHGRLSQGIIHNDIKKWFINRYLFSMHKDSLSQTQLMNLELAKECFGILEPNVSFSKVDATSFDIYINSPSGEIPYEYLSSGFKSTIIILLGLIKEIEYRFKKPQIYAANFDSVFLIDEIDLHLHPEWQAKLILSLKKVFPKAQIIATTHSPHALQVCKPEEIIALGLDQNGNITQRDLPSQEYGFQGWNVEEILTDVMGMSKVRSPLYLETLSKFESSLSNENKNDVITYGEELTRMLHPESELRKLIALQIAPYKEI